MAKLSIIVPVYNMNEQLKQCVWAIRRTVRLPYELIVVDDGSATRVTVPSADDDVRILRSEEHCGFSYAVNMGIRASVGEVLLFLHADTMLTPYAAEDMIDALIGDTSLGAVSAVALTTDVFGQCTPAREYHSWEDFVSVAEAIRDAAPDVKEPLVVAELYALMVRRDAADVAGLLDERYAIPAIASYDYTIRMTRAGYGVAFLPKVYVHHTAEGDPQEREEYNARRREGCRAFHAKWGVSLDYSFHVRRDLLSLMDLSREGLRVLEIGCACGATLREIGAQNRTAKLYGVELNENAATIAAPYATILSMNVEQLDPTEITERFDYIIMADVIEHLTDPWTSVRNMRELLVPGGVLVASIPNVANIRNLFNVVRGFWSYQDLGLLDRTHLRFFTKYEIIELFQGAGYVIEDLRWHVVSNPDFIEAFRKELLSLKTVSVCAEDLDAYQYFVLARRA